MANVQTETQINGLGTIMYCNDSAFDTASKAVLKKSDELISFRDLAYARIQDAKAHDGNWKESSLCTNGSYVKEGSLFVPNASNKRIWLRESIVLKNPSDAVSAHKKGDEYLLKRFKVESHLEKVGSDNYLVLTDTSAVPTNRFGEDARTVWAFSDQAPAYGQLLQDAKISKMNIYMHTGDDKHIDSQSKPFANQLWLYRLDVDSDISSSSRDLGNVNGVRGVRRDAEGVVAQKSADLYSPQEFLKATESLGITISGDLEKKLRTTLKDLRK